ncbi:LysR family transcriptional regulator substrate-binding protein [Labrys okinawensis]|uniref:LysR family transcriptional regulator substrate-binding protein n=1 Tax=Labrys okinawensis TaxID=346911 RepID=UPI0039BD775C
MKSLPSFARRSAFLHRSRWLGADAPATTVALPRLTWRTAATITAHSRGQSAQLAVGIHTSLSAGNFRAILMEHWRRFPDIELHMVDGSSDHLISALTGSAIDIAFVTEENPRWTDKSLPVWTERVVAAIPESHPLIGRDLVH